MQDYESRFAQFIRELETLDSDGKKVVDYGLGPEDVFIEVAEAAYLSQIEEAEKDLNLTLPPSLKSFFLHWDGAVLYKGKYRPGCILFSLKEMVARNHIWQHEETIPEDRVDSILLFADMGDGDYLALDTSEPSEVGEYPVVDGDHNFPPRQWQNISTDFAEWLNRFIEAEGKAVS